MRNAWLIGKAEYLRMVRRKSFILSALGLPLLILAIAGFTIWLVEGRADHRPLGLVDLAGVARPDLARETYANEGDTVVEVLPDEPAARAALDAGEIQAYYVISADYLKSREIALVYESRTPSEREEHALARFLQASLAQRVPAAYRDVATRGVALWQRDLGDGRESSPDGFPEFLIPFILGIFFVMTVMGSGGYLLQAVSTEKENRMVEVMFTTVSPLQFIAGKSGGLMAAALTQTLALIGTIGLVALIALLTGMQASWLSNIRIPWAMVGMVMLFFLPTFALVAGLMITIGSIFDELQYAQQIAGLLNLLFLLPLFFFALAFSNPDGPVMVALTLFPTTSMMGIALRWGFTVIPLWQILLAMVLLVGTAAGMIWVAGRVFRVGMLRYGQPLNLAAFRGLLAGGHPAGTIRAGRGR